MSSRHSPDSYNDRDRDYRRDDGWQREPVSTVLIKNVPDDITERDLDIWFDDRNIRIKDVRLIPRKSGSRGAAFAFVEFHSVQASADWMNKQQGLMRIMCESGEHVSGLVYSRRNPRHSSRSDHRDPPVHADWTCSNCNFINFAKRSECYRCSTPKHPRSSGNKVHQESDDGSSQVGSNPCNTVIIRGLDGLTTERSLLDALAAVTSLEPKNCYVMRNFTTGVSLGYAFMEFDSAMDGKKVRDHFNTKQSFEVDGKLAMVEYAKNTYSTILASIQYQGMDQSQQSYDRHSQYRQPTEYELQALAASSANQMSKIQQHYDQGSSAKASTVPTANGYSQLPQYPDPDVSTYRWDAASGYYYDDSTGLYYDANSQYYYNMTTQEFMYWDGAAKTYVPVSSTETTAPESADTQKSAEVPKEKEEKKNKAKNIAKEMEKWAKSQNKKSKSSVVAPPPAVSAAPVDITPSSASIKQAAADMAYDVLMGKKLSNPGPLHVNKSQDLMPPPSAMAGVKRGAPVSSTGLVASYGGDDSDGEEELVNEVNHIDRQKLTCNLCERKFNSTAILEKHVQMSDLHKQNLIKFQQTNQGQLTKQYRDRAKERRLKEGNTGRATGFIKPHQYA